MQSTHRSSDRPSAPPIRAFALVATLATGLLTGALLSGCGGSSPSQSAASKEAQAETRLADFAKCMREHGFDAEVATLPTGGRGLRIRPGSAHGPGASEAAQGACARYQPEAQHVSLSPQQRVEREESVRRFAQCMRAHGIQVEASTKNGNLQILLHGHPGSGGPNPESPAFQRVQGACQKLLPKPPARGTGAALGGP